MIIYTNKHKIPFQIDDEYLEPVSYYSWYIDTGYPTTSMDFYYNGIKIGRVKFRLHEFLFGKAPKGLEWDHINRVREDCCKENLQLSFHWKNILNADQSHAPGISGHWGIHWGNGRWTTYIPNRTKEGRSKPIFIGHFNTIEEALQAQQDAL